MDKRFGKYIFIVLIIAMIVIYFYERKIRSLPQRYTVGTVKKVNKSSSGGFIATYEYQINGETFRATSPLGYYYGKVHRYEKYLVAVPEGHKKEGLMLFECRMQDTIQAPIEGWRTLPEFCQSVKLDNI